MFYEETPSEWNLGYRECNDFLGKILSKLELCDKANVEMYLFNHQIDKKIKNQILKCISEQLLVYINNGKLENYRKTYQKLDVDDLALPDRFVRYYCENYYMMKNCAYYGQSLNDIYFSCCLSKTENEMLKRLKEEEKKSIARIEKKAEKIEEEKIKKIYNSNFSIKKQYSYEEIRKKYFLGKSYNTQAFNCYSHLQNARNNDDFNSIDSYEGKLYTIIIRALQSNCIDFNYKLYWQVLNDFLLQNDYGICELKTITGIDINYLRIIICEYLKNKEYQGYLADLKTKKIYTDVYETYKPSDFSSTIAVGKSKRLASYSHSFYM